MLFFNSGGKIAFVGGACAVASKFAFGFTSTGKENYVLFRGGCSANTMTI